MDEKSDLIVWVKYKEEVNTPHKPSLHHCTHLEHCVGFLDQKNPASLVRPQQKVSCLFTRDCRPEHGANVIIKFVDGLIKGNHESEDSGWGSPPLLSSPCRNWNFIHTQYHSLIKCNTEKSTNILHFKTASIFCFKIFNEIKTYRCR